MSMMPIVDFIALANGSFEEGKRVERERIVLALRQEAANHESNAGSMGLSSPALHGNLRAMALALRTMADRIERGET